MNICIGGPWDGAKLLGRAGYKKTFNIKDKISGRIVVYFKRRIIVQNKSYIFWLSDDVKHIKNDEIIKKYFYKYYHNLS